MALTEPEVKRFESALDGLGLLRYIPRKLAVDLKDRVSRINFEKGDSILRQGRSGNAFFILTEGTISVRVEKNGKIVKTGVMKPVSYFGEIGLLELSERTATLIAEESVEVYMIGKTEFFALFISHPEIRKSIEKTAEERRKTGFLCF
jgi:CRP/FNR family transcriptional regulator, cyclic AMP receptor protein